MLYSKENFLKAIDNKDYIEAREILLELQNQNIIKPEFAKEICERFKDSEDMQELELLAIAYPEWSKSIGKEDRRYTQAYAKFFYAQPKNLKSIDISQEVLNSFEIIIPTYNRKTILLKTLEDIKRINPFITIRISDNGSQDGTYAALEEFSKKFQNVFIRKNAQNLGLGRNCLALVKEVQKPYFVTLSDEDSPIVDNLLKALEFMKQNDINVLIGSYFYDRRMFNKSCDLNHGSFIKKMELKEFPTTGFMSGIVVQTSFLHKYLSFMEREDSVNLYPHCGWILLGLIFGRVYYYNLSVSYERGELGKSFFGGNSGDPDLKDGKGYSHPLERWKVYSAFVEMIREIRKSSVVNVQALNNVEMIEQGMQPRSIRLVQNLVQDLFPNAKSIVWQDNSKLQQLTQVKSQLDSKSQELESLKSQYDSKIKELQVNLKATQDSLSSLPIKKQTLEIKNLESDLKIKELKAKQIEKELEYRYNILEELDLKKQELIKVKQQLDSTKKQLESKNTGLESNLNYPIFKGNLSYLNAMTSAKDRIHNHLSYKLGKAMIENSKSILGYIRMLYVLSYIKEQHNKEQKQYQEQIKKNPNLKLPKLESYKDYKEALKEKECFTYKLGEALMKADKTWYKGGYVKLWFEAKRLEREYREKRGG
ncbi:glycosyltransferase [Helicobacter pullorum]